MRFQKDQLVAVMSGGGCRFILQIKKVTPTGRVTLSNGMQYRNDGTEMGDVSGRRITEVTPEIRRQVADKSYTNRLVNIRWYDVDFETKARIIALLDREQETK